MATERLEPFRQALVDLRRRLRDGALAPGARITAKAVAETLRLSPTPVREALSRMAGEGVLEERRGDGFFVPALSATDLAILYRLSEQLLLFSQELARQSPQDRRFAGRAPGEDPVRTVERLFRSWASESGSRVAAETYRTVSLRLAPARRREAQLIADLAAEADGLLQLDDPAARRRRAAAIQAFHRRRVALAEPLARLLESPAEDAGW